MTVSLLAMRVTIDGRVTEVERGTTILAAAAKVGIEIPTLCWHPKVSILGACRICLVEVEGLNKLIAACQTPVGEGMVVKTDTPVIRRVRQTMLELLLANHPLDCLQCDKGGECDLQRLTFLFGPAANRFALPRRDYRLEDHSPFIERDTAKCILCRRCIRVCQEVRGVNVWGAMYRGFDKKICTFFEQPLDKDFHDPYNCEFCGSCVDICPVGALVPKSSKHQARPWELDRTETACPFCGVGCVTVAHHRRRRLIKTTPRRGGHKELGDLCFRGRFATGYVNHPSRLTTCLLRRDDRLEPADAAAAVSWLGKRVELLSMLPVAFIGTSSTESEAYALASYTASVAPSRGMAFAVDGRAELEEGPIPLYQQDRSLIVDKLPEARKLLIIGHDLTMAHPVAGVRIRRALASGAKAFVVDPYDTLLGRAATWWLRASGAAYPALLTALAGALSGFEGEADLAELARMVPGLAFKEWPLIIDWLKGPGETVIVLQKMPAPLQIPVRQGVTALAKALPRDEWKVIYLTPDANGFGVPLMAGASGCAAGADKWDALLGGAITPSAMIFLRADPLGEQPDLPAWPTLRRGVKLWVSFDSCLTATAAQSDLVIPLPHFTELAGTIMASGGSGAFRRLYPPPSGVLPLEDIISSLPGGPTRAAINWGSAAEVARLREDGRLRLGQDVAGRSIPRSRLCPLPGSRGNSLIFSLRRHRFPGWRLRLSGGRDIMGPRERIEVNPADARERGIKDGDRAVLSLADGRFVFVVAVTTRIPRGHAALPFDPEFGAVVGFASWARGRGLDPWCGLEVVLEKEG